MGSNPQAGNVLFLILIAVALFAALSYAVTSSQRTGGSSADQDKAKIKATQILDYSAYLAQIYQRLILNGNAGADIKYYNPGYSDTCKIGVACFFSNEGGGGVSQGIDKIPFNIPEFPVGIGAGGFYFASGHSASTDFGNQSFMSTSNADTIVGVDYLPRNICSAINKLLSGNDNIPDLNYVGDVAGVAIYDGTLLPSQPAGCFEVCAAFGSPDPCYSFVRVIEER